MTRPPFSLIMGKVSRFLGATQHLAHDQREKDER